MNAGTVDFRAVDFGIVVAGAVDAGDVDAVGVLEGTTDAGAAGVLLVAWSEVGVALACTGTLTPATVEAD